MDTRLFFSTRYFHIPLPYFDILKELFFYIYIKHHKESFITVNSIFSLALRPLCTS